MMDFRSAFKEQYHAALAMLADCVELCPNDLWVSGADARTYWRIAFHTAYFAHLYLGQDWMAFRPWPASPEIYKALWKQRGEVEPYELPETIDPLSREDALAYIAFVRSLVDPIVDHLDLDTAESGFPWYAGMSKLSHELLSLRHIQGHVGQLSELLMARGIDTRWIGRVKS